MELKERSDSEILNGSFVHPIFKACFETPLFILTNFVWFKRMDL